MPVSTGRGPGDEMRGEKAEKKIPERDGPASVLYSSLSTELSVFFFATGGNAGNNPEAGELLVCVSARQNWSKSPNPVG